MKPRVHLSAWKSAEAEQRIRELEDALIDATVIERPQSIDLPTHLGSTRAYHWPGGGTPVVFLHGATGNAMTWVPYAERRGSRAMYAIDTIGDIGRSHQEVPVEDPDDLVEWLDATLVGLGLREVHLAGTSYGGFLALELAAHQPGRVRSLCLIEPGGVVRVRLLRFLTWGMAVFLASFLPGSLRRRAGRILRMPMLDDPRALKIGLRAQLAHRSRLLPADPLRDEELRSINVPVLAILGAKSGTFPASVVRARLDALLPDVEVDMVPDAGHALSASHVDHVAEQLTALMARADASPPGGTGGSSGGTDPGDSLRARPASRDPLDR